jgi:glycosyltransferase involved in cell wall biosynthesis
MRFKGISADYLDINGLARKLGFRADLTRTLTEALLGFEPDVAIATWYPTAFPVWLSYTNKPLYFVQDFPELVWEAEGVYGLRLFETTLRLPFHFLANSNFTKSLILKHNRDAKVTVTGVGVDLNTFYPRNVKIRNSRGKPIIMTIIRSAKCKGGEVALKSLNIINKELPVHVILVGRSAVTKKLFSKIKPEFIYSVFESIDDESLAKLYSSSDVFIFTSYRESFGLPPLEAMACGAAVVTTDCGGNMDYTVDGYNSLVVPPGNPEAIARATLRVLKDDKLKEKLIEGGIETAKRWTWDKVTDKFEEAIKE